MNADFKITDELVYEFLRNSMGPLWEDVLAERWEQFKASKQPKREIELTTEDNMPIYRDEDVWYVNTDKWNVSVVYCLNRYTPLPNYKYFSTKEKAEEYVLHKKELFSLDEIMDILRTMSDGAKGYDNKSYLRNKFCELAKDKLK